jgi:hypothetical protein
MRREGKKQDCRKEKEKGGRSDRRERKGKKEWRRK